MTDAVVKAKIDPLKAKQLVELKHTAPLFGCRIDPSGRFVFAAAQDNTIQRWEIEGGKKTPLVGHQSWMRGMAFLPSGKVLFSAGYEGRVLAWPVDAEVPQPLFTIDAHKGWVRAVAVSPDGKLLATCGNDNLVKLWTTEGRPVRQLEGHASHVYNVAFHPGGQFVVSAELKGVVKQWDAATGAVVRTLDAAVLYKYDDTFRADIGGIRGIAFNGDGSLLACSGITEVSNAFAGIGKPLVVLFDWSNGQKKLLRSKEDFTGTAWGVVFHPEGFLIGAGGGQGGAVWFWKPDLLQAFHTLKVPNNARDLDLHPDGRRFAVAFYDGILRLYDLTDKT